MQNDIDHNYFSSQPDTKSLSRISKCLKKQPNHQLLALLTAGGPGIFPSPNFKNRQVFLKIFNHVKKKFYIFTVEEIGFGGYNFLSDFYSVQKKILVNLQEVINFRNKRKLTRSLPVKIFAKKLQPKKLKKKKRKPSVRRLKLQA